METNKLKLSLAEARRRLTKPQKQAVRKYRERRAAQTAPRIKVERAGDTATLTPDCPNAALGNALLAEAFGTADRDFVEGLLNQLACAGSQGTQIDERALNFLLSVVKNIKPRDQLEAMLAAQMAVTHMAIMQFGRRLTNAQTIEQRDSAERGFNKLARTFSTQSEALKRYRNGGEQKVTVQHVTVTDGGQAIVGNVTQAAARDRPGKRRRAAAKTPAAAVPSLNDARPLEKIETPREPN